MPTHDGPRRHCDVFQREWCHLFVVIVGDEKAKCEVIFRVCLDGVETKVVGMIDIPLFFARR